MNITREQVRNRLLQAGWHFKRQAEKVDLYRKPGSALRVALPRRDLLPEVSVRTILAQAGLTQADIEQFLRQAVKS
jgi:hypothetical protein